MMTIRELCIRELFRVSDDKLDGIFELIRKEAIASRKEDNASRLVRNLELQEAIEIRRKQRECEELDADE